MKNEFYTAFYIKPCEKFDELWVETKSKEKFETAMDYAKNHNVKITRVILPDDEIEIPDFTKTINF